MLLRGLKLGAAAVPAGVLMSEEQRRSAVAARCAGWFSFSPFSSSAAGGDADAQSKKKRQQLFAFGHGADETNSLLGAHHLHTLEPGVRFRSVAAGPDHVVAATSDGRLLLFPAARPEDARAAAAAAAVAADADADASAAPAPRALAAAGARASARAPPTELYRGGAALKQVLCARSAILAITEGGAVLRWELQQQQPEAAGAAGAAGAADAAGAAAASAAAAGGQQQQQQQQQRQHHTGESQWVGPLQWRSLARVKVVGGASGPDHQALITAGGGVLAVGANAYGQLGLGAGQREKRYEEPRAVEQLAGVRVAAVACGEQHTLFLDAAAGVTYSAGSDQWLQLGLGKTWATQPERRRAISRSPVVVSGYAKAANAAANANHAAAGGANGGRVLGVAATDNGSLLLVEQPKTAAALVAESAAMAAKAAAKAAAQAAKAAVTAAAEEEEQQQQQQQQQRQRPAPEDPYSAHRVATTNQPQQQQQQQQQGQGQGQAAEMALLAQTHVVAWTCGYGRFGELGDGQTKHFSAATRALRSAELGGGGGGSGSAGTAAPPTRVSCGSSHCAAVLGPYELLLWGRNDAGQLGRRGLNASGKPLPPTNQAKDGAKVRQWLSPGGPAALNMVECGFNRTVVVVDVDDA